MPSGLLPCARSLPFPTMRVGVSPGPGGNFVEGRKAVSVGLTGSYLERWRAELSYTGYFGAEDINLIHDRDFITMNMKYFF